MVFFAILIPILFACAGLAVDLGNGFARHARLQMAAALAGAATFAMNQETVDTHPKADCRITIHVLHIENMKSEIPL